MTYSEETIASDGLQSTDRRFKESFGVTRESYALHRDGGPSVAAHDRACVVTAETVTRDIMFRHNRYQLVQRHAQLPGNAVAKAGSSSSRWK